VNQVHRLLLALPARNKSALQRRTKQANVLRTRRKFRPCPISKGGGFPQIPRHLHLIQYFTKNQIKRAPRTRCKGVLRFTLLTTCVSIYYVTTYLPTYLRIASSEHATAYYLFVLSFGLPFVRYKPTRMFVSRSLLYSSLQSLIYLAHWFSQTSTIGLVRHLLVSTTGSLPPI